jgi:branched-chain amino acid transport system permease protein
VNELDLTGQLLQLLFTGFTLGGIYALIALALVTTFNITGVLNMAQGEFLALGALLAASLCAAGASLPLAFVIAVATLALLGGLLERSAIHPARHAPGLILIIITIALSPGCLAVCHRLWTVYHRLLGTGGGRTAPGIPAYRPGFDRHRRQTILRLG